MVHKIIKILFLFILIFCMTSTVFASDYMFNGEVVPATSTANDNFFGVETIVDVLEKLGYPYDDITKVSTTYYINEYMEYYKNNIDEEVKALNVCFLRNSETVTNASNIYILIGNGTFSNTLPYLYMINTQISAFDRWAYSWDGKIISAEILDTSYGIVNKNAWSSSAGKITYTGESSQTTASVLNFNWIVAPVETYAIASRAPQTGYGYYFLENTYEFNDSSNSGDSGGNSGDSGGNSGGTIDLTMTNDLINKINTQVEEISKKIPTSGDIEQATTTGVTNGLTDYFGGSGDADFSGENTNISSGDIITAIGYTPPDDPYANFWWELTEILNNALTGTNRTLTLEAINNTYTISIDDIDWNPPETLRTFLTLLSTTVVCWVLIKYIKITIDKLSSGSIDEVLAMNEECGIVDLF